MSLLLEKKISLLNEEIVRSESKKFILSEMKRIGVEKLPYSYSALNKFIDSETMDIHYNKHYKGYVKKLNKALSEKDYGDVELEKIIKGISRYNKTIRNNAGGAFNHALFWKMLSPKKQELTGELLETINKEFGSLTKFKKKFEEIAKKSFGSGWIWLTLSNGKLKIVTTPNQDNPLMNIVKDGGFPILGLDLWEHAYYLKYRNERDEYISNFWNCVNWEFVSSLYMSKQKKKSINESVNMMKDNDPFECNYEKEKEYKFVFNINPQLKKQFQDKIQEILKELFPKNWYEHNEYSEGEIRGLYDFRGEKGRSILNLITTNYSCYCILICDTNKVLASMNESLIEIIGKTPGEQLKENQRFLSFIERFGSRIFSSESKTLKKMTEKIKSTKAMGERRENFVVKKLRSIYGYNNVSISAGLGLSVDTNKGIDCKIRINDVIKTGQIKPYGKVVVKDDKYEFHESSNIKKYDTDFLIFQKSNENVYVFDNVGVEIKDGVYIIPKTSLKHKI